MRNRAGAVISVAACLVVLALLAWPYVPESVPDINAYYGSGVLNPLVAGVLAIGVIVAFAAARGNYVSAGLGAGIALGLGLFVLLVLVVWAVTARVDVFRAPGWFFPAQRWILVGLSVLIVFGAAWHARALGLLFPRR